MSLTRDDLLSMAEEKRREEKRQRLSSQSVQDAEDDADEYEPHFYCATCDGPEVKREGDHCIECLEAMAEDAAERRAEWRRDMEADRSINEQREDV